MQCAVCAMKGSGLGRCSMQLAGGCLIHKQLAGLRGKTIPFIFNNSVH